MKKMMMTVMAAALLWAAPVSQAQVKEEPDRTRDLLRLMEQEGWPSSETGDLERYMEQRRWRLEAGADPEGIALAMSFARSRGEGLQGEQALRLMETLAVASAEARRLGYEDRQFALCALQAVRNAEEQRRRLGSAEGAQWIGAQIRERIRTLETVRLRQRAGGGKGEQGEPGGPQRPDKPERGRP